MTAFDSTEHTTLDWLSDISLLRLISGELCVSELEVQRILEGD